MSRYIDADALKGRVGELIVPEWVRTLIRTWLESAPTVDAVPVVLCEKCRHGIKNHGISDGWVLCTKPYVTDTVGAMMHRDDWFCADGERKENNNNE